MNYRNKSVNYKDLEEYSTISEILSLTILDQKYNKFKKTQILTEQLIMSELSKEFCKEHPLITLSIDSLNYSSQLNEFDLL